LNHAPSILTLNGALGLDNLIFVWVTTGIFFSYVLIRKQHDISRAAGEPREYLKIVGSGMRLRILNRNQTKGVLPVDRSKTQTSPIDFPSIPVWSLFQYLVLFSIYQEIWSEPCHPVQHEAGTFAIFPIAIPFNSAS
jgi:hypothetical protein